MLIRGDKIVGLMQTHRLIGENCRPESSCEWLQCQCTYRPARPTWKGVLAEDFPRHQFNRNSYAFHLNVITAYHYDESFSMLQ